MTRRVEIVEVGPRDGLQNEAVALSPEDRAAFVLRLEAAGVRRIEAVSFVHPGRVPQMAGAEAVLAALPSDPSRSRIGLVLNVRGWERLIATACDEANVVVCATDAFGRANQGSGHREQMDMFAQVAQRARSEGPPVTVTVAVAFGCPFEGEVPLERVVEVAREADAMGVKEIALADTIGVADPWEVRRRIEAVKAVAPDAKLRLHFHDTRRTGLANAYAAIEAGADVLDASCGGIGGCPFAPKATGNIATEDLVYMLDRAGIETGLDLDALIATAHWIGAKLGKDVPSGLSRAGGFPTPAQSLSASDGSI